MKKRLLVGALAGAAGGLAMKAVVHFIDSDSFGLSTETDTRTTHEICRRMNWDRLSDQSAARIGAALHYGFAVSAGVAYTAVSNQLPAVGLGRGAAFGAALWLIGDEAAVTIAGLEDPLKTPFFSHCSALAAHVLYGMLVDAIPRAML